MVATAGVSGWKKRCGELQTIVRWRVSRIVLNWCVCRVKDEVKVKGTSYVNKSRSNNLGVVCRAVNVVAVR
jgi:hypothetical protein